MRKNIPLLLLLFCLLSASHSLSGQIVIDDEEQTTQDTIFVPEEETDQTFTIDTTGLNSLLNLRNSYFPMQAAGGIEIGRTFNFGGRDRTEYGINILATSWHHLERHIAEGNTTDPANIRLGMFQIGAFVTANRGGFTDENTLWQFNAGVLYNALLVENRHFGITLRAKASTLSGAQSEVLFLENLYLTPAAGLTFAGIVNFYYGRTVPVNPVIGLDIPLHSLTLNLNLNVSYFKFGLQGI